MCYGTFQPEMTRNHWKQETCERKLVTKAKPEHTSKHVHLKRCLRMLQRDPFASYKNIYWKITLMNHNHILTSSTRWNKSVKIEDPSILANMFCLKYTNLTTDKWWITWEKKPHVNQRNTIWHLHNAHLIQLRYCHRNGQILKNTVQKYNQHFIRHHDYKDNYKNKLPQIQLVLDIKMTRKSSST